MIYNDSFLFWSVMVKTSRPSFESFKTKWERILAWLKTITVIYHHFVFCEHVSSLEILHFEMLIPRISNVFRTMIIFFVAFGLAIRHLYRFLSLLYDYVSIINLIRRYQCYRVHWLRSFRIIMFSRSMQLSSLNPLNTLISCEFH
jgi:hypothetical protein